MKTNYIPPTPAADDIIVRQSTIASLQLCPGRVGLSQEEGFISTPSKAMYRGSLAHGVIAKALLAPREDVWAFATPSRELILATMEDIMPDQGGFHPRQVASIEQIDELVGELQDLMASWVSDIWEPRMQYEQYLMVEQKVVMPLDSLPDGRKVWLQGTPDAVTEAGVFDWKTGSKAWPASKDGLTKGSFGPQAPLYLALAEHATGLPLLTDLTFVVYSVDRGEWEFHKTTWTSEQVNAALDNAVQVGLQIAGGGFPYTPFVSEFGKMKRGWHCSPQYCGAWNICPGKRMIGDGYDTEQVATAGW